MMRFLDSFLFNTVDEIKRCYAFINKAEVIGRNGQVGLIFKS